MYDLQITPIFHAFNLFCFCNFFCFFDLANKWLVGVFNKTFEIEFKPSSWWSPSRGRTCLRQNLRKFITASAAPVVGMELRPNKRILKLFSDMLYFHKRRLLEERGPPTTWTRTFQSTYQSLRKSYPFLIRDKSNIYVFRQSAELKCTFVS